jgi:hypothetical protein
MWAEGADALDGAVAENNHSTLLNTSVETIAAAAPKSMRDWMLGVVGFIVGLLWGSRDRCSAPVCMAATVRPTMRLSP